MQVAAVMGTVFVLIFLGELPDKSMFATLVLATRGRLLAVWAGACAAFTIHVAIAVTAGGFFALLPKTVVDGVAAGLFAGGAIYVWREGGAAGAGEDITAVVGTVERRQGHRVFLTAFLTIFVAEWGDITQILVANLAARYAAPLRVAIAALVALCCVAALAVTASRYVQRLPMLAVRRVSAAIMVALAVWSALSAAGVG